MAEILPIRRTIDQSYLKDNEYGNRNFTFTEIKIFTTPVFKLFRRV